MRVSRQAAIAAFLVTASCCGGALVPLATAADPAADTEVVTPARGKKPVQINQQGNPETPSDGATIYLNDHIPTANGRFFVFGTTAPRRPDWGEALTLVPNTPAPLEIRSIEFSVQVTATSTLVAEFDFWNTYNTAASPVNSGLLGIREGNYGSVPANAGGQFYAQVGLNWDTAPIPLGDPNIFIEFKFKSATGAGAPLNVAMRPIADAFEGGPNLGTSPNDVYADQNADGIFTFSALNAGDRRLLSNTTVCGPTDCQTNWHLHIRGGPNPNTVEPGMDLFETPVTGGSQYLNVLAAGLFDFDDFANPCVPPGFGSSDAYSGGVALRGIPLTTLPAGVLGPTDTIVVRTAPANLPTPGSSATIPVEIVAMSLQSIAPITITYDGGQSPTQWNVRVCLSASPQTPGSMTITKGQCVGEGTYTETLPVLPKLVFTPAGPPPNPACTQPITIDFGPIGSPPLIVDTLLGHFVNDVPPTLPLITDPFVGDEVDHDCDPGATAAVLPTTTNFHPGVVVPRCPSDDSCPAGQAVRRQINKDGTSLIKKQLHAMDPLGTVNTDGDGVEDGADNCQLDFNPLQPDGDDDAAGDVCDNCVSVCNPGQEDADINNVGDFCDNCIGTFNPGQENADGDAFGDACDPCPLDPTNSPPGPVQGLTYNPNPDNDTVVWSPVTGATSYDIVKGALAALPVGPGAGDESCNTSPTNSFLDTNNPNQGAGFFYAVRAVSSCGQGIYGLTHTNPGPAENGPPRSTTTCP